MVVLGRHQVRIVVEFGFAIGVVIVAVAIPRTFAGSCIDSFDLAHIDSVTSKKKLNRIDIYAQNYITYTV